MAIRNTPFWTFLSAVIPQWGDAMTGRFSAPLVVLSAVIYLGAVFGVTLSGNSLLNKILIVGPLVLLLAGGVYAVYKVWRIEYERNLDWKAKFTPTVTVKFDESIPSCQSESEFNDGTRAICFRLEVENVGYQTVDYCEGYLTEVHRVGDPVLMGIMRLTWATSPTPFVSLVRNVRRHLDLVRVREDGKVFVASELGWPINQEHFFDRRGDYIFKVVFSGRNMTTLDPKCYRLSVTTDWQTAKMREE